MFAQKPKLGRRLNPAVFFFRPGKFLPPIKLLPIQL
jgi:hypothetical protein